MSNLTRAPIAHGMSASGRTAALTENMSSLRRFWRKAYAIQSGGLALVGTVTTTAGSAAVAGTGTTFTRDLMPGNVLKKTDGTVLGTVLSVQSDIALTLVANAAAVVAGASPMMVPQLNELIFGDSYAGLKQRFIDPQFRAQFGLAGNGGWATNAGISGLAYATSGAVTFLDGTANAYDYTYSITGQHFAVGVGGVLTLAVGGADFIGNYFATYFANNAGGGTCTVDFLKGGVVQSSLAINTAGAVALQIASLVLNAADARSMRITGLTGTCIVLTGVCIDRTKQGYTLFGMCRGGLDHPNILSCPNPQLYAAIMADIRPDFATYEMLEGNYVATTLPQIMGWLMNGSGGGGGWANTDWLFIGHPPTGVDGPAALAPSAPGWVENEMTRAYAVANGAAYFDGWTPIVKQANLATVGLEGAYDGTHALKQDQDWLATLLIRQFGLDQGPGGIDYAPVYAAPLVYASTVVFSSAPGANAVSAGSFAAEPNFGIDTIHTLNRFHNLMTSAGTRLMSVSGSVNNGYGIQQLAAGLNVYGFKTVGNYNDNEWSMGIDTGTNRLLIRARFNGVLRGFSLPTSDQSGANGEGTGVTVYRTTDVNFTDVTRYGTSEARLAYDGAGNLVIKLNPVGGGGLKTVTLAMT